MWNYKRFDTHCTEGEIERETRDRPSDIRRGGRVGAGRSRNQNKYPTMPKKGRAEIRRRGTFLSLSLAFSLWVWLSHSSHVKSRMECLQGCNVTPRASNAHVTELRHTQSGEHAKWNERGRVHSIQHMSNPSHHRLSQPSGPNLPKNPRRTVEHTK